MEIKVGNVRLEVEAIERLTVESGGSAWVVEGAEVAEMFRQALDSSLGKQQYDLCQDVARQFWKLPPPSED